MNIAINFDTQMEDFITNNKNNKNKNHLQYMISKLYFNYMQQISKKKKETSISEKGPT